MLSPSCRRRCFDPPPKSAPLPQREAGVATRCPALPAQCMVLAAPQAREGEQVTEPPGAGETAGCGPSPCPYGGGGRPRRSEASRACACVCIRVHACACECVFAELTVSVGGGRTTLNKRNTRRFSDLPSDPATPLQGLIARAEFGASGGTSTEVVHCTVVYITENAGNRKRLVK